MHLLDLVFDLLNLLCWPSSKKDEAIISPENFQKMLEKLPERARIIHLKELNKTTEKIFTRKWFLEYWNGNRSAYHAWFTWILFGDSRAILSYIAWSTWYAPFIMMKNIIVSLLLFYISISLTIWWRCARNSTPEKKYFVRSMVIVEFFTVIYKFVLMFV